MIKEMKGTMNYKLLPIYYTTGSVVYAFSQWLMILLITRLLGIDDTGYYAYYLSILTPINILFNGGLRLQILSDVESTFQDRVYLTVRYYSIILFVLIGFIFVYFVDKPLLYLLVLAIKAIDSFSELEYGNWNRNKLALNYAKSHIYRLALMLIIGLTLYVCEVRSFLILLSFPISLLIVYLFYDRVQSSFQRNLVLFKTEELKALILKALPLAVSSLLTSLNVTTARVCIKEFLGTTVLSEFVYLMYFNTVASILVVSGCQVYIPFFAKDLSKVEDLRFMLKCLLVIVVYSILFTLFIITCTNSVVAYLYSESISYTFVQTVLFTSGTFFSYLAIFGNAILISKRNNKVILINSLLFLGSSLLFYPLCILYLGFNGALLAWLICSSIICILNWYSVYKLKLDRYLKFFKANN